MIIAKWVVCDGLPTERSELLIQIESMNLEDYITRKNAMIAVDKRIEKLSKDKEFNYSKLICVAGVKSIIADIPSEIVIPTKDRYAPLKKILADYGIREGEKHNLKYLSELERELIEEILNENRND